MAERGLEIGFIIKDSISLYRGKKGSKNTVQKSNIRAILFRYVLLVGSFLHLEFYLLRTHLITVHKYNTIIDKLYRQIKYQGWDSKN